MSDEKETQIKRPNFPDYFGYGSVMREVMNVFESPQPIAVKSQFPFSTSSKPALSNLTQGKTLKHTDRIQLIQWLQAHPPWKITPELMIIYHELKKEMEVNWESAQNGIIFKAATGSIRYEEKSQKWSEEIGQPEKKGYLDRIFGGRKYG